MKRAIIFLPTLILCGIYKFLSFIFAKLKNPSKRAKYFMKYEDKLFSIFSPYRISPGFFTPIPSKNYKFRHGMCDTEREQDYFKQRKEEVIKRVFAKWTPEQQELFLSMKGSFENERN